jgi:hypothetical protein
VLKTRKKNHQKNRLKLKEKIQEKKSLFSKGRFLKMKRKMILFQWLLNLKQERKDKRKRSDNVYYNIKFI